jgi:hypothetical protein
MLLPQKLTTQRILSQFILIYDEESNKFSYIDSCAVATETDGADPQTVQNDLI